MRRLTNKRVLVTGGAGFIGSHLVDRIIDENPRSLVIVDNLFLGKESNLDQARAAFPTLCFYREDGCDFERMQQIVVDEEIDVVFNLAVVPLPTSLKEPRFTVDVNVSLTNVAVELLRLGLYSTLVHVSSSEAYGTAQYVPMDEEHPLGPSTPYAASKIATDHVVLSYLKTFGVDAAIARPFNNYGPRQNEGTYAGIIPIVITRALRGQPINIFGDGEQTRDFVFVRDSVEGIVRVYNEPNARGRVINVATGQQLSVNVLVRTLLDLLGADVPIVYQPPRPGEIRMHCGDNTLAKELLDFEPATELRAALSETIEWYRSRVELART